jgi:hypothetical protein
LLVREADASEQAAHAAMLTRITELSGAATVWERLGDAGEVEKHSY